MAIGAVNFKGEEQQKRSSILPGAVIGAAAGAGTGYLIKDEIGADKFLEKYTAATDEFKPSKTEGLTPEQTTAVDNLKKTVTKNKTFKADVDAEVKKVFADDKKTEATAEEYAKYKGYNDVADITTKLNAEKGLTESLNKAVDAEKDAIKNLAKDADEATKKAANGKLENAENAVKANAKKIAEHEAQVALTKDGKAIPKATFTELVSKDLKGNAVETIGENLKPLKGLLEKVTSMKKVAIFAGIGLLAGAIIGKLMSPKAEAPAEEPKA